MRIPDDWGYFTVSPVALNRSSNPCRGAKPLKGPPVGVPILFRLVTKGNVAAGIFLAKNLRHFRPRLGVLANSCS